MIPQPEFTALMSAIGLPQAAGQYGRFALYCRALQEWNQKINLTTITDDEGVAVKHFADSLLPLTMAELPQGASLVDVGSGAGFPGLPMALVRPDLRLTFLDSLQKRLTFLEGVTAALGVPAAFVHARAELPPFLLLCDAVLRAKPSLRVLPPLILEHSESKG